MGGEFMESKTTSGQRRPVDDSPRRNSEVLYSAIESIPAAMIVYDRSLNFLFRNLAASNLFPEGQGIAEALTALSVEGPCEDWRTELQSVWGGKSPEPRHFDLTVTLARDQPEMYLHVSLHPLRSPQSADVIGGILLAQDVTAQTSMERRLALSERLAALGKLAARVAHELNNPLDGMLRYLNLAARVLQDKPFNVQERRVAEYVLSAKSGALRMRDIISSLLQFSRKSPGAAEQATINKIVEDAVTALEGPAQESNVTVVCHFHQSDMPVVRGSSLFQVFCNLIKNAIDAMPQGGTLAITTRIAESNIVVSFDDTGEGLPEDVDRIFEPFFTTKAPGKGTGLGLAVCKELIEKYNGTIIARRRQPRGASFVVTIPTRSCAATTFLRGSLQAAAGEQPTDSTGR